MANEYIAKTFHGLEPILAQELKDLGASNIEILNRAVAFEGDDLLLYRANLSLRTALRIMQPLRVESVETADQLYEVARSTNWQRWFSEKQTFAVHSTIDKTPNFNNSMIVSLKVKDAIADQFTDMKGSRPFVERENPDIRIEVHIFKDRCTISIDSTGDSLHKRGYRTGGHIAPLNELLAAAMVKYSGWTPDQTLIDPMCGSGTIITEAALIAKNISPNIKRENFSFTHWKHFDKKLFERAWLDARGAERSFDGKIIGYDINKQAIQEARDNVARAGVDEDVRLSTADFFSKEPPKEAGMLIFNPPYGERLQPNEEIFSFYKNIGNQLKQQYKGWTAWLICGNFDALRKIGLRPEVKHELFNGAIECDFAQYKMY